MTEHERLNYLNDHISYEATFMRLMTVKASTAEDELERNAFLEAFGVHAWNLVEFLSKKVRKNDRNASDYIPSFEPPDESPSNRRSYGSRSKPFALQCSKKLLHETNSIPPMPANFMRGLFRQSSNFRAHSARVTVMN